MKKVKFIEGLYIVKLGDQYYFDTQWTTDAIIWTTDPLEAAVFRFKEAAEGMIQKNNLDCKPIRIK